MSGLFHEGVSAAKEEYQRLLTKYQTHFPTPPHLKFSDRKVHRTYGKHQGNVVTLFTKALPPVVEQWRETTAHELAHAAKWLRYGGGGHGTQWKAFALLFGANPRARVKVTPYMAPHHPTPQFPPPDRATVRFYQPRKIFDPTSGRYLN